jgi:hypothetical protein
MTDEQAADVYQKAFIAFPGVGQWVRDNSPDVAQTLRTWRAVIMPFDYADAVYVLNKWVLGDKNNPPPTGYQKEVFAIHLRQAILAVVGARLRAERSREILDDTRKPRGLSAAMMSIHDHYTEKILPWSKAVKAGEMDETEYRNRVGDLMRKVG